MKSLRIAYILPSLDSKAPIFLAKRLSNFFIKQGFYVKCFYFDEINKVNFLCETERISINKPIDFDSFDIIHTHMMRPDKYVSKFSYKIKKAKTISTIHCNIKEDLMYSYGKIIAIIYNYKWLKYLRKINVTVQINDYLMNLYQELPCNYLIYNGISLSKEKDDYSQISDHALSFKQKGKKVLCSYSGLVKRKGLLQILQLLKMREDLSYICIGEGVQENELKEFTIKNNLTERVYFSPFKKNPYYVLEFVDIFVIPSYSEGFSLALLEAGSIGTSVVCSNIPSFTLPFTNDELTTFELNDIDSLSNSVDEAIKEKEYKKKNLKNKIQKSFTEEKMFLNYQKLYEAVTKNEKYSDLVEE